MVYKSANKSAEIFNFLTAEMRRLENELYGDLVSNLDYQHLYGFYWLFEDRLSQLGSKPENTIIKKDAAFRKAHQEIKEMLYTSDNNVSSDQLFPLYKQVKDKLKVEYNLQRLAENIPSIKELEDCKAQVDRLEVADFCDQTEIYEKIFGLLMEGKQAEFYDAIS